MLIYYLIIAKWTAREGPSFLSINENIGGMSHNFGFEYLMRQEIDFS